MVAITAHELPYQISQFCWRNNMNAAYTVSGIGSQLPTSTDETRNQ